MNKLLPLVLALAAADARPQVGDVAPDFKLPGSNGQSVSLALDPAGALAARSRPAR